MKKNSISIENEWLSVSAIPKGAELISLRSKRSNIEHLWQADEKWWPRHAPILFPVVGKPQTSYALKKQEVKLTQHGFARDLEFECTEHSATKMEWMLTWSEHTLDRYPFEFLFFVTYEVYENKLLTTYTIENGGDKKMYYSVGAHPAFRTPWLAGERMTDYYLWFEVAEKSKSWLLNDGFLSGGKKEVFDGSQELPLSPRLFDQDALVFKDLKSKEIRIKSKTNAHEVIMRFDGFPYFGIWSKKDCDQFVCLEPWSGIAESIPSVSDFEKKEGILSLDPEKIRSHSFEIEIV